VCGKFIHRNHDFLRTEERIEANAEDVIEPKVMEKVHIALTSAEI